MEYSIVLWKNYNWTRISTWSKWSKWSWFWALWVHWFPNNTESEKVSMQKRLAICIRCFLIHICIRSLPIVPPLFCLSTSGNILSQSYNATVFYFDNVSFLAHVFNQLFLPNESSISQATNRRMVLTICFQLFKKQTILWRWGGGGGVKKKWNAWWCTSIRHAISFRAS